MTWDLTVDGVHLNDLARFTVTSGLQGSSLPGVQLTSVQIPGTNGVLPVLGGDFFEAGSLVLKLYVAGEDERGRVYGSRQRQYDENIDLLLSLFGNRHRLLDVRRRMADGSVRQANCRVSDSFTPDVSGSGVTANINIALEIPGCFWADVDAHTFTGTAGSTSPHTEVVDTLTGGTAPIEDATFTVTGPCTSPRISQPDTGGYVQYSGTLAASDTWTVNSATWESSVGGSSVVKDTTYAGSGSRFLTLTPQVATPGGPRQVKVTLTGSGMGATTNLSITAKRKFF